MAEAIFERRVVLGGAERKIRELPVPALARRTRPLEFQRHAGHDIQREAIRDADENLDAFGLQDHVVLVDEHQEVARGARGRRVLGLAAIRGRRHEVERVRRRRFPASAP